MKKTKKIVTSGLLLAACILLPFLTGQIPKIGSMLCPMHIPVLICGFVCGWQYGLIIGLIAPLLRFTIFGMPPMPTCLTMAFELATYGAVSGFMYNLLPKNNGYLYLALVIAMIYGRIIWGIAQRIVIGTQFSFTMFISGAVLTAIPGIIVQLVIIPIIVMALKRARLVPIN